MMQKDTKHISKREQILLKDEQIILKIRKYMLKLKLLLGRIEHQSYKEIDDGTDGLALTQCVTNLYELAIKVEQKNIPQWLETLRSSRVAKMRNIDSHDYDATNWDIAKNVCRKILHDVKIESIDAYLKALHGKQKTDAKNSDSMISKFS